MVYYEYAGDSVRHNVSVSSGVNTYLLTGLPTGGVRNISIVAVRHLPNDVAGPVDPGEYYCRQKYEKLKITFLQLLTLLKLHYQDLGQV